MTTDFAKKFSGVDHWVFDLDNTLYEADCHLFAQIDARMTDYIRVHLELPHSDARKLQKDYYVRFGTTMSGLMSEHGVCPDHFLEFVHDIDLSPIKPNHRLREALCALPGRRFIFTNGSTQHAENVTRSLGVNDLFDDVFDIRAAGFTPKPHRSPYETFVDRCAVAPSRSAMFEDIVQNLEVPHALGMTTVLVCSDAAWLDDEPQEKRPARPEDAADHVDFATNDLAAFLEAVYAQSAVS